jgi:hypothetical protein
VLRAAEDGAILAELAAADPAPLEVAAEGERGHSAQPPAAIIRSHSL